MNAIFSGSRRILVGGALLSVWVHAVAGSADLATAPLQTSTATLVKPNIFYVLDDSGSMDWDFLPDWASYGTAALVRNARFNGVYYDPAVTYSPPLNYDGSSYPSMTASYTSSWTKVPYDGFGVESGSDPNAGSNVIYSGSSTTQNLTSSTFNYFYTFVPGEYCTSANLRTCNAQTSPTTTYPVPAYLRWCTSSALSTCQASYINTKPSGGSTYTYPRYPGARITSSSYVPGSAVKTTLTSTTTSYPYPGTSAKASTRTDCAGTTCTYAEEMTNFANWWAYYHTRMQMTKSSVSIAFSVLDDRFRLGYMSINNNTGSDFLDIADNTTNSGGQKANWYSKFINAFPYNSTPLRIALATAGRYYAGKLTTINDVSATDPMQYACQRNYTIVSTDGYWNENATPKQVDGSTAVGDADGNGVSNTLSDVAAYYYKTDIRSSALGNANNASGADVSSNNFSSGQQRMNTYTLGLGASGYMQYQDGYVQAGSGDYFDVTNGTATSSSTQASGICIWQTSGKCTWPKAVSNTQTTIDDLWHAAVVGGGTYYSATNPTELKVGLANFLNSVTADYSSAAAATLSSPNLSAGATNYVYGTNFCSAKWFGELARYSIDPLTGSVSAAASWAESGAGTDCTDAAGGTTTTPLLDQTGWTTRNIYTYDSTKASTLINFQWSSLNSTMQGYFKMTSISSLSQICASGATCLPTSAQVDSTTAGTTTGAGGINLVNYLRGDRENEGSTNARYYFPRTHVLGDIVNSAATYVGAPSQSYVDNGYATFKSNNSPPSSTARQPVVYVGANDGMLHAFNADTGAELWSYIPSMLLPKLYKLADKNYASNHAYYVDGPITKADVYYNSSWHTILVGGLGQGGRGFYALDVTDPTVKPTVLWEFTSDTSKSLPYITDADLGYSYGAPVVTKLSDGTWVVLITSGYNNVSPGSGHDILWVLNAKTGTIIKKIDTGLGTSGGSTFPAGCTVQPCPSGLAKISAWVDSPTNNTALQVYGGDLYGNLWRFDLTGLSGSGGTATVQLLATLFDPNGSRQPITARPELGVVSGYHVVYVGTGRYLGVTDIPSTQVQSIYAIKDPLTTGGSSTTPLYDNPRSKACGTSTTTNCFVKVLLADSSGVRTATSSVGYSANFASMNGFFEDLPESAERINTDPTLQLGTLVYTSNIPSSANACSVGGSSYLNYINYSTGLAVPRVIDVGVQLSDVGLSSSAALALTINGKPIAITKTSDGKTTVTDVPAGTSSGNTRRLSWRELIVGQ